MEDRIRRQWETNADSFADLINGIGTPHHRHILNPCLDELIGDVKGKKLLDAGCGEGYLARHYAKTGAIVTAVDISQRLIETAEKLTAGIDEKIKFEIADICHLDSIPSDEFDIVLSNLVLLNIPCLETALHEIHRVLRKRGFFVFSIVHPSFNFYGPGEWEMGEKDSVTGRREGKYFKIDRYFDEIEYERYWMTRKGDKFPAPISFFHRTLTTYLTMLIESGFRLTDFREPVPSTEGAFFNRERRIPFFAVFKAKKE